MRTRLHGWMVSGSDIAVAVAMMLILGCAATPNAAVVPAGNSDRPLYIDIGAMGVKAGGSGTVAQRVRAEMRTATAKAFHANDRSMSTAWSSGSRPTRAQLDGANTQGVYLDGTVTAMRESGGGRHGAIDCSVDLLLATYPDKSMFAFLSGKANVPLSAAGGDVSRAKEVCVAAVIENLVETKVIPTLRRRFQ